ncbi:MAG: methyltransferase [Deltaproteobacteria bacterium]|nr:MAG: methyltransferase [Deltaproteobacteria bacterium]
MTLKGLPRVTISHRGAQRLSAGHPWVFSGDVRDDGGAVSGDVVLVQQRRRSGKLRVLGCAFFNRESMITLRLIESGEAVIDRAFWRRRLQQALELRARLADEDQAGRLVFAESDGIPGLIADRYHQVIVLQTLCAGAERLRRQWVELLQELTGVDTFVERNDTAARRLEGLPERAGMLQGRLAGPLQVRLGGLLRTIDPLAGQKTGGYLDQRHNHRRAGQLARGRCLDVFSYQGGFGLSLAAGGGTPVTLLDQSERALEIARADAASNRLQVETRCGNAFDVLRGLQQQGQRFHTICLDPPAFAKNKRALESALRGYKEINLRALKLLEPGGLLITSSCSYHLSVDLFEDILLQAARDARRQVQLLERRGAASDHPERLGFPESRYLKCLLLRAW